MRNCSAATDRIGCDHEILVRGTHTIMYETHRQTGE